MPDEDSLPFRLSSWQSRHDPDAQDASEGEAAEAEDAERR